MRKRGNAVRAMSHDELGADLRPRFGSVDSRMYHRSTESPIPTTMGFPSPRFPIQKDMSPHVPSQGLRKEMRDVDLKDIDVPLKCADCGVTFGRGAVDPLLAHYVKQRKLLFWCSSCRVGLFFVCLFCCRTVLIWPLDKEFICCVCESTDEKDVMLQCDQCNLWQHGECLNIRDYASIPRHFLCTFCMRGTPRASI